MPIRVLNTLRGQEKWGVGGVLKNTTSVDTLPRLLQNAELLGKTVRPLQWSEHSTEYMWAPE